MAAPARAQPPVATAPPVSELLIEAEEFKVESGPWRVIGLSEAFYAATMSNTFISRQKLLAAPPQAPEARASYRAVIPAAGRYRIWSRYECPSRWSVEHTLRIEQDGRVVFERKYGQTASPKTWPMHQGFKAMADFSWGSGDNIVWEPGPEMVSLRAGPARLTLLAGPQPEAATPTERGGAAARHVDCFLFTTDPLVGMENAEHQMWHVLDRALNQKGEAFLRVSNPRAGDGSAPAPHALAVEVKVYTHSPYYRPRDPLPPPLAEIAPGQASPWVPIGQALDTTNMQELVITAKPPGGPLVVELSRDPAGRKILRRVERRDPAVNSIILEIPHDLRGPRPVIRTVEEWHADLLGYLRSLPPRGDPPREIPVLGLLGASPVPGELRRTIAETGLLLGRNTWRREDLPEDLAARYHVQPRDNLAHDVRDIPTAALEKALRALKAKGALDQVSLISLGDEIAVGGFDPRRAADNLAFQGYLAGRALPAPVPQALSNDPARSQAYYWSQRFAVDRSIDGMAERTRIVEQVLGPAVRTGANYSPHPDYFPYAGSWVRMFRRRGMTMPWSEDYVFQVPEASMLVSGYLCDVMRAAARPADLPVQMYTMPHFPGQTPRDFTLSVYSSLAHGNRVLNFFAAHPIYVSTENYIAWAARDSWRAVRDVVHDVGQADELLARGRVRPAEVAFVISDADDIWERAHEASIYNFERKNLYYLLRHAQVPIDFVADEDFAENPAFLRRYKVLVVSARHLARATAQGIRRWVAQGGKLLGVAGAGTLDEYEAPLGVLDDVFGIARSQVDVREKRCWAKEGLAWLPALAEIAPRGNGAARADAGAAATAGPPIPVLAVAERVTPGAAEVRVRTTTGDPAVLSHGFEKGSATRFTFFPGAAYLQAAIPRWPYHRGTTDSAFNHFLPTAFNQAAARLLLRELRDAGVSLPVVARTDGTRDLDLALDHPPPPLDVGVIDAREGTAVVIANYSGQRIDALTLTLRAPADLQIVQAARAGKLTAERSGDTVTVTLPVDWADMVMFRR